MVLPLLKIKYYFHVFKNYIKKKRLIHHALFLDYTFPLIAIKKVS